MTKTPSYRNPTSEKELIKNDNAQRLNQFVIHPKNPTDVAQVKIPTYDINKRTLSSAATTELQQSKNTQIVLPATEAYYFPSGPHPIELPQLLLTKDSPKSPSDPTKSQQNYFSRMTFLIHPEPNDSELHHVISVVQELQELALHVPSEVATRI